MNKFYNKHYIRIDGQNRIIDRFSDAHRQPQDGDICINEQGGYQFRLEPDGEENPDFVNDNGIPLYKWDGKTAIPRTDAEIQADITVLPLPVAAPAITERVAALESALLTAMMGGHI